MRWKVMLTCAMIGAPIGAASGQAVMTVPYGGEKSAPVSMVPVDPGDTPEEIAKDAARDLKDSRFYNKPGATRAQYDADWQTCRLIARGSRTPTGTVPFFYNPAVISPVAAGIGGGIGGIIGAAIAQGQQRRDNRRQCLLIKGWRLVDVPSSEAAKVTAMTEDQRSAYFNRIVGAPTVNGAITERTSFSLAPDPALALDAPVRGPASVFVGKKIDPASPFVLAPGEAAVVLAFRRPDEHSAGRSGRVQFARYDLTARDVLYPPKDWKKNNDQTTYGVAVKSADKKATYEIQIVRVTAGDYVLNSFSVGPIEPMSTHCFGAPTFHVNPGEVAYLGDFIPLWSAETSGGAKVSTLAWTSHLDEARTALATKQPTMAAAMKPAAWRNKATYGCSGMVMTRWDLPGVTELPDVGSAGSETAGSSSAGDGATAGGASEVH